MKEHRHKHGQGHGLHSSGEPGEVPKKGSMGTTELVQLGLLYVGIPAVTLYPLGFVGLGVQLWRDPFFPYTDFTTTWDAVALIEEAVVIATGIELIYLSLVATVLGVGAATLILHLLERVPKLDHEQQSPGRRRGLRSLFLVVLLPVAALLTWSCVRPDGRDDNDLLYLGAFVVLSVGAGALVGFVRVRRLDDWFIPALAVAWAGAILASLSLAALQTPALALVEIDVEPGVASSDCSGVASDETYVKLSEGVAHWHLYNRVGLYAVPHEELHRIEYKRCLEYLNRN